MLNATALIESTGLSDVKEIISAVKASGIHVDAGVEYALSLVSKIPNAESITAQSWYSELLSIWGISMAATRASCILSGIYGAYFAFLYANRSSLKCFTYGLWCVIGHIALNADVFVAIAKGRTIGVHDIGYRSVEGVGDVFNITQLERSGTKLGYFDDIHPMYVNESSLFPAGFTDVKAIVVFNDRVSDVPPAYGIEAVHKDGYDLLCIGGRAKPESLVEKILSTPVGVAFEGSDESVVCSSFSTNSSVVDGAFIAESWSTGPSLPLLRKRELVGKIRASSDDDDGEDEDGDLAESNEQFMSTLETQLAQYGDIFSVANESDVSVQSSAKPFGSSVIFTDSDGKTKTRLIANYHNAYGPPFGLTDIL